jgi:phosphocarrier protein
MQKLSWKPGRLQSARHDDGEGRHEGVFVVASRTTSDFVRFSLTRRQRRTAMEKSDTTTAATHVKELLVQNKMGIHARPAAMIVRVTNKFKSEILVEKEEEQVNGKSIMGLMMLAAAKGSLVKFIATGDDAPQMLQELEQLFSRKFDEA